MKAQKQLNIAGWLILIIGIIHCCARPLVLPGFRVLHAGQLLTFIFMFICTGLATMFIGWIQLFITRQEHIQSINLFILHISVWLMLLIGIGAVATMWDNPFAYLILLVALYELIWLNPLKKSQTTA